jgi:adenylate cyclase
MARTHYQQIRFRTFLLLTLAGAVMGVVFIFFGHGIGKLFPFFNGLAIGTIAGMALGYFELYLFERNFRQWRFVWFFLIRFGIYTTFFIALLFNFTAFSQMIRLGQSYPEVMRSPEFLHYLNEGTFRSEIIYVMLFAILLNFTRIMNAKLGQGMLINYLKGTYHRPVLEERIILFLSLANSKAILKELGPLRYFELMNRLFYRFTEPVIAHRGIIFEYVEDLLVVTWSAEEGLQDDNCVQTLVEIRDLMREKADQTESEFGLRPELHAGMHIGTVVCAEMGEVKTQIVFHGDSMNTTARILSKCEELGSDLLISEDLRQRLGTELSARAELIGAMELKGKQKHMELSKLVLDD